MWCLYLFFNISNQKKNQTTYTESNNTNNPNEHGNNERKYLKTFKRPQTLRLLQMIIISVFFIKKIQEINNSEDVQGF